MNVWHLWRKGPAASLPFGETICTMSSVTIFFFLPNPQARENSHLTKFSQMTGNETLVSNLFFEIENRRKDTCRLLSPGT